ncbi:PAP2 (acid phosphatase) superfamily protein [Thioflavicoccus mobilis 8321]|uniref:PAP2 (Acid phosphatase) superfamily protein n=1 Tax=Thioflavicoccus mobilis 8321 TaxID=765912 RepID=L0H2K8_9GAMM|nr:phosphatase PAP2 family protein [Thioflavicoccus mobilis]AGA92292.1 PAP2 (acid phosphatase) superfamily protein [Thioflavicoccus mobilis 8321]
MSDQLLRLARAVSAFCEQDAVAGHLRGMNQRLLAVPVGLWIAFFVCALIFIGFPDIDLAVSGLFYMPGVGFTVRGDPLERLLYHSVEWLTLGGGLALIGTWGYSRFVGPVPWSLGGRELGLALLILALGPGLIVNGLLKEHWGRARPADIIQFGGDRAFSPAFVPTGQGGGSFSSGHVAAASFWTSVALLAKRRRGLWLGAALGYALLIGLARIAAGGHFLSDVVTSFFIVLILTVILRNLLYRTAPSRIVPSRRGEVPSTGPGRAPIVV